MSRRRRPALAWLAGAGLWACTSVGGGGDPAEVDMTRDAGADAAPSADAEVDAAGSAVDAALDADAAVDAGPTVPCVDIDGDGVLGRCPGALDCDDGDPTVRPGAPERCNLFDDDCDGRVDEAWPGLGAPCTVGLGVCGLTSVRVCRADGVGAVCPVSPAAPDTETCNGLDDDCDGTADEAVLDCCPQPGLIRGCSVDQGACRAGVQTCGADRAWQACDGVGPVEETCNGVDDDCDGVVDEGVATTACGDCGPAPAEACNGLDDDCDGQVDERVTNVCGRCGVPPEERCDGQDQDCDGQADEGQRNRCGACGPLPVETCDGQDEDCDGSVDEGLRNRCGECGPERAELCNGLDDDCDGALDEGLPGQGEPCTVGAGQCAREGLSRCTAEGLACDAAPGPGAAEACSGVDDDCDGRVDEGGVCPACDGPERCNGLDDDCDDAVDEGVANACGGCGPLVERCDGVDDDCDGAVDEGVLNACGACGAAPVEQCNGADDDCDGRIDERFSLLGQPCRVGVGACALHSTVRCLDLDTAGCGLTAEAPTPELCNGRDDDCDGAVDEGLRNACGACGVSPLERCDGVDQDCDAVIDEGFDLGGDVRHCGGCNQACDDARADRCEAGTCRCGAGPACDADHYCAGRLTDAAACTPRPPEGPADPP